MSSKEIQILESAQEYFLRYGFKKTNIEEIAKHAGIGKGTVYNYFGSKEELFICTCEKQWDEIQQNLQMEFAKEKDMEQKLVRSVLFKLERLREFRTRYSMTKEVLQELIEVSNELTQKNLMHIEEIRSYLEEGEREGIFKPGDHEKSATLIYTINLQFVLRWSQMEAEDAEQEVRDLYELILEGIRK